MYLVIWTIESCTTLSCSVHDTCLLYQLCLGLTFPSIQSKGMYFRQMVLLNTHMVLCGILSQTKTTCLNPWLWISNYLKMCGGRVWENLLPITQI
jgi:hypothetical protein